jgi:hypothetical protein
MARARLFQGKLAGLGMPNDNRHGQIDYAERTKQLRPLEGQNSDSKTDVRQQASIAVRRH